MTSRPGRRMATSTMSAKRASRPSGDDAKAVEVIAGVFDASQRGKLVIWTIYDKPSDHPEGCIARRFEVGGGGPAPVATSDTLTGELQELQKIFWKAGLMKLSRQEGDELQIVESWI
jgi:hypothetical protein